MPKTETPNNPLQQTGHANEGFARHVAQLRVSRLLSFVVRRRKAVKLMSRGGLGRNDPCFCGSGKKYKKCCYPRTLPDFSKPNAGLPSPFEEREAIYRAMSRQEAHPPRNGGGTIDTVDVGRTRLLCAPLAPYGDEVALPGTLAPPTPSQVEAKYNEIRDSNPEGVTEVVVTYTYPEMFGFADARMVFDADEHCRLVDGRAVRVLDLFRDMQVAMADGSIGTIVGNPERRHEIPVPPLPAENGLWTSLDSHSPFST